MSWPHHPSPNEEELKVLRESGRRLAAIRLDADRKSASAMKEAWDAWERWAALSRLPWWKRVLVNLRLIRLSTN